jgi:hypothetical protein
MKYPQNKYFLYSVITALIILICFRKCGNRPEIPDNSKKEFVSLKKDIDSVKPIIIEREKEVIKWRTRWREVRHDSLIPCEELLVYCDTLVLADSSLIAEQKVLIGIQDSVIRMQDIAIKSDSVTIRDLSKEIKKQKRLKWLFLGIGLVPNIIR